MKKALLLALMLLLVASTAALASYSSSITVTETAGTSYDELPIVVSMDNSGMADDNYITSTGLDTRVLSVLAPLPHMLTNNKTLFVSDILGSATTLFDYTTGESTLGSFYIITGYNGYNTISDAEPLELGNNFTIELSGYVDTSAGSDKNLVYKEDAFRIYIQADEAIRAAILSAGDVEDLAVTVTDISSGEHIVKTSLYEDVAVDFDGTGQRIASANGTIDISAANTMAVWVQVHADPGVAPNARPILAKGTSRGLIFWATAGIIRYYPDAYVNAANYTLTPGDTWYRVVGTWDGSLARIYVNGVHIMTGSAGGTWTHDTVVYKMFADSDGSRPMDGMLGDAQVYSRAWEIDEVAADFAQGRINDPQPINLTGLVAWWKLNDGTGTSATDSSGNSNTGTLTGATWDDRSFKIWIDGNEHYTAGVGVSVPDNAFNWLLMENNAMPYMESFKIWVD